MKTPPEPHLKSAIQDQLEILRSHVEGDTPLDAVFVREHAMLIVQMIEVLLDPEQRLVRPSEFGQPAE